MWEGCTPVLGTESEPSLREITGWEIPGIGEMDVESEGYRTSVLPSDGSLHVELAFSDAYVESEATPYRRIGPVLLALEDVRSLGVETVGAPTGTLWKRVLQGDPRDELLRMAWDENEDVLYVRGGGTVLSCRGGTWHWQVGFRPPA
ncbi:hypothetical protein [Streptomyces filamentosus]|uniref:hypothetical protein n=1 Tax=Streptomyces filamentosus TaxID=67294 RepID=UPI00123B5956|nr:hypothetical protein [Streptomyces filamentosus]KAA6210243.1 hypothetical protein CP979_27015 [Streptomyces filamentosus]